MKAIKTFVEVFKGNCNQTDYRGQTPLHILVLSGKNSAIAYLCER